MNAFKDLSKNNPYYSFKVITTNMKKDYEKLSIPVCLLELDDILNLLDATNFSQIAMVETALVYVKMFAREDKEALDYKTTDSMLKDTINSEVFGDKREVVGSNGEVFKGYGFFVQKYLWEEYRKFGVGHAHDLADFDTYHRVRGLRWPVVDGKET